MEMRALLWAKESLVPNEWEGNRVGRTGGSNFSLEMKICCPCRELSHDYVLIQSVM